MSLTFFYAPMSTATLTSTVFAELAVPHERVRVRLRSGDLPEAFLKANPNGLVPTIVHDGTPIFESAAITMYLGEQFGVDKGLYPAPGPKRGEAMKWIVWTNVALGEAMYRRGHLGEWAEPGAGNPKAVEKATADLAKLLLVLEGALADRAYLLGATYSLADTHLNSYCDWLNHSGIDFSKTPNVTAWMARCAARPAYQAAMAAEMAESAS